MKVLPLNAACLTGFWLALAAIAFPTATLGASASGQEGLTVAEAKADRSVTPLLSNVQLIGASITAGFGSSIELKLGRNAVLSDFLRAAWADHNQSGKLEGKGNFLFFRAPGTSGRSQVTKAGATSPSLVVAIDFLFWYGFGHNSPGEPRRLEGLEKGLAELDAFECPLVIGTIPNVDHALAGKGPGGRPVLFRSQFPTEEERAAMNTRINAWAAERKNVEVIDVDGIFRAIVTGTPVMICGEELKTSAPTDAFQDDLLHLTLNGYVWTALAVCEATSRLQGAAVDDFVRSPEKIRERFLASIKEDQAKQAERVAKRLKRKAARDARKQEKAIR